MAKIKAIVEQGFDVNQISSHDQMQVSPLYLAAEMGHLEAVVFLLEKGADKNFVCVKRNQAETSILTIAARNGHKDVVEALLEAGADANNKYRYHDALISAYEAKKDDIVLLLIEKGASLSEQERDPNTLLHRAISKRQQKIAIALIEKSSEKELKMVNKEGHTPLYEAIVTAQPVIINLLIQKKAHQDLPKGAHNLFCAAAEIGDIEIARKLIDAGVSIESIILPSPLIVAYLKNDSNFVDYLLNNSADPNCYNAQTTLLGHAVAKTDENFVKSLLKIKGIDLYLRPKHSYY